MLYGSLGVYYACSKCFSHVCCVAIIVYSKLPISGWKSSSVYIMLMEFKLPPCIQNAVVLIHSSNTSCVWCVAAKVYSIWPSGWKSFAVYTMLIHNMAAMCAMLQLLHNAFSPTAVKRASLTSCLVSCSQRVFYSAQQRLEELQRVHYAHPQHCSLYVAHQPPSLHVGAPHPHSPQPLVDQIAIKTPCL